MRTFRRSNAGDSLFESIAHLCLDSVEEDLQRPLPGRKTSLHSFFPSLSYPGAKTDVSSACQHTGHGKLCSNPSSMSAHSAQPKVSCSAEPIGPLIHPTALIHDVDG